MKLLKLAIAASLALGSFAASATVVSVLGKNGFTNYNEVNETQFTRLGVELLEKGVPVCLVDSAFLNSNGIDGMQLRTIIYNAGWRVECSIHMGYGTELPMADRMFFVPQE